MSYHNFLNNKFLKSIHNSMIKYSEKGPRSSEKIKPVHGTVAELLSRVFKKEDGYEIEALGYSNSEAKIPTMYGDYKNVDIGIKHNGIIIACVMIKVFCSSYNKNSKNYIENMCGETNGIRSQKNENGQPYIVWQLIVCPEYMPNYKNDKTCTGLDYMSEEKIQKYVKISESDKSQYSIPDITTLVLVNTGNEQYFKDKINNKIPVEINSEEFLENISVTYSNINEKGFSSSSINFLNKNFSYGFDEFVKLVKHKVKYNKRKKYVFSTKIKNLFNKAITK